MKKRPLPTIEELEEILNSRDDVPIEILPNGELTWKGSEPESPTIDAPEIPEEEFIEDPSFTVELTALLNKHSIENESDTPDFILMNYLMVSLDAFNSAVNRRTAWYAPAIDEEGPMEVGCKECGGECQGHEDKSNV